MSKQITIPVPDGKRAKWIDGVLPLVDEQKVDNRPVTERIKTFTDAYNALGDEHPLVKEYLRVADSNIILDDLYAYLKLRIIVAALNEGWEPQFTEDEYRYFPWFYLYNKKEYDKMDEEEKGRCLLRSGVSSDANYGVVYCSANLDPANSSANFGTRLAFRTRELAAYAGRQFTEEWADFTFKPHTGEELNEKEAMFARFNDIEVAPAET